MTEGVQPVPEESTRHALVSPAVQIKRGAARYQQRWRQPLNVIHPFQEGRPVGHLVQLSQGQLRLSDLSWSGQQDNRIPEITPKKVG